ncbi:MAG TPA: sensor histidine kinase KdpD [Acidimicrobiales bacterium]|nr:sensor histidine kinase KdpD [Acidimicrobiales bacterium]
MARGTLRIYLGAAPGVGKTYAMLNEGRRRHSRGTDVVVGYVETHGRPVTAAQIGDLEVIPRKRIEYRGSTFEEMDTAAIIARHPKVALVDELAHTNVPGSAHPKRWQDVEDIVEAGIDVITTLNIQHLESVNDVVERITGIVQRETIPDACVRAADQIELVDMTPEALRRRMAHGNIYAPEKVDAALSNYFRVGNLAALRELALLWVADRVDDSLQQYMEDHGITGAWETRERVVVAMTGAPGGEALIRRAARMATRAKGDLLGVHVRSSDGLAGPPPGELERHRELLKELGGMYREVAAPDPVTGLVTFARSEHATQLVLGSSHRSRIAELLHGSVINSVIRQAGEIDVHVISTRAEEGQAPEHLPRKRRGLSGAISVRRQLSAGTAALVALPLLTLVLTQVRHHVQLGGDVMLYLAVVIGVAMVGGTWPALASAVAAFLLTDWFFVPPLHTFTVATADQVVTLVVFLGVAAVVSWLVGAAAQRALDAARGRAEAAILVRLAGALLTDKDPLTEVMSQVRTTFNLDGVALLHKNATGWHQVSVVGDHPPDSPDAATEAVELSPGTVLAIAGPDLAAEDRRVLRAFSDQLAVALRSRELQAEAATAELLAQANDLRTALLRAVSHDLRTPLASIKASATTLLAKDLPLTAEETHELLETIDEEADRLNSLIGNLLDMSRLQSGALELVRQEVGLDEVVARAVASLGDRARQVVVDVPENLPHVHTDAALLERAIANVVDNAIAWSPPDAPVRVEGASIGGAVELRVVDRGPGIPLDQRENVFRPFQRLGDKHTGAGMGLGLAVARGFVDALGGELTIDDTPGGGTTMLFRLGGAG